MRLDKIYKGMIIKNYKELCNLLDVEMKKSGSNSYKAQWKEFDRYFKSHKDKRKIIIDEIYNKPLEKQDGRSLGNNSIFMDDLNKLILDICGLHKVTQNTVRINLTPAQIMSRVGLVNEEYKKDCKDIRTVANKEEYLSYAVYDFFNSTKRNGMKNIRTALDKLQKESYLTWGFGFVIIVEGESYSALPNEVQMIMDAELYIIKTNGYDTKTDIIRDKGANVFNRLVKSYLRDNGMFIDGYYRVIYIIPSHDFINVILEQQERNNIKTNINNNMITSCTNSVVKRQKEAQKLMDEKKQEYLNHRKKIGKTSNENVIKGLNMKYRQRLDDSYLDDTIQMIDKYIKIHD